MSAKSKRKINFKSDRSKQNILIISIALFIVILLLLLNIFADPDNYRHIYEGYDLSYTESGRGDSYTKYLYSHENTPYGEEDIEIDILSFDESSTNVEVLESFEGENNVILQAEESELTYKFNVPKSGLYNIFTEYYPIEARGIDIEREVYINGKLPFLGSEAMTFRRVWGDESENIKQDNQGNDIRPSQVEKPRWEGMYFEDYTGYYSDPYMFYFEEGENTLTLKGVNEPFVIKSLEVKAVTMNRSYDEYLSQYDLNKYKKNDTVYLSKIQAESSLYRSSPSLYASFDRSSGTTEPYSVAKTKLNMMGGSGWRVAGQWIEWDIDIPEDGMYKFSFKARQNYNRGMVSTRTIYIDDEIPCNEVKSIPFRYSNDWELVTLADDAGNDLYFPLDKGKHTLKMQISLGELSDTLVEMQESIYRLNQIYLKILVLTGPEPDTMRDYRVNEIYPEIMGQIEFENKMLYKLVDDLTEYTGERGAEAATVQMLAKQTTRLLEKPQEIPKQLINFQQNISNMGTSLVTLTNSQLDLDWLIVSAEDAVLPKVKESFGTKALHEIKSFVASFFVDYNAIGNVYTDSAAIEAWMITSGRDQSTILKTMIDDTYTPTTGNLVNVKLINANALLPATVAGNGPDVALTVQNGDPINYAFRKASHDLSKFPGFDEVLEEFAESAVIPYKYLDGVYGLPEQQFFNVMFYRKDIFEDMGLELPETWSDLVKMLPVLQKMNFNAGIPSVDRRIGEQIIPDTSNFFAQLYQNGATLYNENGSKAQLDTEAAVVAFENYTKYFTHYKTPLIYDFVNRFRTGEMPIGFADYNTYNTLIVSAPEIRGLWDFAVLPGTPQDDGTINRSTSSWGYACMMLANTGNPDLSWEFLKWWVSAETQVRFGRELESVLGASARYPTANRVAFRQLSWSAADVKTLEEQWDWVVGTPEVPGGYYTQRHIVNAARRVINQKEDTRETLLDYNRTINEELEKKRKEFGLE